MVPRRLSLALLLALAVLIAGCGGGPADGSGADVVEDDTPEADEDHTADEDISEDGNAVEDDAADEEGDEGEAAEEAALGTRDNPLDVGTEIEMGDWTLTVTDVDLDATDEVLDENEFNDPPVDGRQFVVFSVDATYVGEDSGTPWLDFDFGIVGSGGNTFSTGSDDQCGVIADDLIDIGETFPDGSVSGNVCFSVESDQIDGGTIRVEELLSFDDTRAFYALE